MLHMISKYIVSYNIVHPTGTEMRKSYLILNPEKAHFVPFGCN